jgi:hypothetical protein
LLFTYGFCLRDNPESAILFDLQDILDGTACSHPGVFNEAVMKVLVPQLESVGGTGEQQAMFSYDGMQPRDSLQAALNMMQQISQKLTKERDKSLEKDNLKRLKEARLEEVCIGLERLEGMAKENPSGCQPMRESIMILMSAEKDLLSNTCG